MVGRNFEKVFFEVYLFNGKKSILTAKLPSRFTHSWHTNNNVRGPGHGIANLTINRQLRLISCSRTFSPRVIWYHRTGFYLWPEVITDLIIFKLGWGYFHIVSHVFLHFGTFGLMVLQLISASKLSDLKNGQKIAFLLIKLSFLANGCILGQNSRKLTPLKIQFYYLDNVAPPTNTFFIAWQWHSLILVSFSLFSAF